MTQDYTDVENWVEKVYREREETGNPDLYKIKTEQKEPPPEESFFSGCVGWIIAIIGAVIVILLWWFLGG